MLDVASDHAGTGLRMIGSSGRLTFGSAGSKGKETVDRMAAAPVIAIATRDAGKFSETFVRRHIEHLFSGRTVIVSLSPPSHQPHAPTFHFRTERKLIPRWRRSLVSVLGKGNSTAIDTRDADLEAFLREKHVTCVLSEFGYVTTEIAEPILQRGIPLFGYFRGNDASKKLHDQAYVARLRSVVPRLGGVIAVSQFLIERLRIAGIEHQNAAVIPSGTDIDLFRPRPSRPGLVLTVGRLVQKKDPLTAARAFAAIAERHEDARWTIVGSGPLESRLKREIRALGIEGRVDLLGSLDHAAVAELMCHAAVCFQPFRTASDGDTEGFPSVIQEAMAAGRAIVTTRHAGIDEHLVHKKNAFLYKEGDVARLADGLDRILASEQLRTELGNAARAHAVQHLDYRALFRQTEEFIVTTLQGAS